MMKTTAKQYMSYGGTALVQIAAEPETTFGFSPGGPEMKSGGLIITEASEGGIVGRLAAVNKTKSFLLLTDADVLVGAKQNRVLNKSILLAPNSKTDIDVSCIERMRWQYTSRNFSSPGTAADPDLRKAKAASISFRSDENGNPRADTQGEVWSHISLRMNADSFFDRTESYNELMSFHKKRNAEKLPAIEPEKGCNGLAVVSEGRVRCIDLFGTEEVYRYYFPLLRDSALLTAKSGKETRPADIHEAFYRVVDAADSFEKAARKEDETYAAAGSLFHAGNSELTGFELLMEGQLIHRVIFGR